MATSGAMPGSGALVISWSLSKIYARQCLLESDHNRKRPTGEHKRRVGRLQAMWKEIHRIVCVAKGLKRPLWDSAPVRAELVLVKKSTLKG